MKVVNIMTLPTWSQCPSQQIIFNPAVPFSRERSVISVGQHRPLHPHKISRPFCSGMSETFSMVIVFTRQGYRACVSLRSYVTMASTGTRAESYSGPDRGRVHFPASKKCRGVFSCIRCPDIAGEVDGTSGSDAWRNENRQHQASSLVTV